MTTFAELPLSKLTQKGLKDSDYVTLTEIQSQSIIPALEGKDILGAAKTGSGKTLAFLIPVIEVLHKNKWTNLDGLGALIISPTRELAYQIYETLRKVGRYHDLSAALIIGGKDLHFEKKRIDKCNILICTPGRLLQHMDENPLFNCTNMKILVLDEADRCLDMGFQKTMNSIIENLPPERQTLLFSATQTKSVKDLARLSLQDPLYVSVHEKAEHATPENLQQTYIVCELEDKISMLWSFIRNHLKQKIIVFFSSCKQVKYVYEVFCRMRPGTSLLALYGKLHQEKRFNIYKSFYNKQNAVLFATDIAARGLDFPVVNWVVQMDCPEDVNSYIHRSGRTARFKSGGESLLVLLPSEEKFVEQLTERKIPIKKIKINMDKLQSPHRKLEALLARDVALKDTAQRAFVAYVKSVFLMKDKNTFNVQALNTDAFARSLGLAIPPRIRFLQRNQKNLLKRKDEVSQSTANDKMLKDIKNDSENESSGSENDEKQSVQISGKNNLHENLFENSGNDDDDDDEFLTIKRKNIQIEDDEFEDLESEDVFEKSGSKNKQKPITKAALAKKILKKKIVANKKTQFDEEGQVVANPTKTKQSELAMQYENENESGINIEKAKEVLREEDKFDKERFKKMVKEKHREEKQKLKAQKKKEKEEAESESGESDVDYGSEESDGDEPDLSWLPDPDKIYGPKKDSEDETNDFNNSDSNTSEAESVENVIHKPPKRKLVTKDELTKKKRNKLTAVTNNDLQAAEELALQLLKS